MFNKGWRDRVRNLESSKDCLRSDIESLRNQLSDIRKYLQVEYQQNPNYDCSRFNLKKSGSK